MPFATFLLAAIVTPESVVGLYQSQQMEVDAVLELRKVPNDLGHVAFRGAPLKIDGSALLMERYDAGIRFIRVRP